MRRSLAGLLVFNKELLSCILLNDSITRLFPKNPAKNRASPHVLRLISCPGTPETGHKQIRLLLFFYTCSGITPAMHTAGIRTITQDAFG